MDDALVDLVARYVDRHFPTAQTVIVPGSAASGTRTATSDVDLLLIGPEAMLAGAPSLARTDLFGGELIEVFAYSPEGFADWMESGFAEQRPVLADMLVHGEALRIDDATAVLRGSVAERLAAGPSPGRHALDLLRYQVTDLADDLRAMSDEFEEAVVRAALVESLARLLLLAHGRWLGTGKWLVRRLRDWDPVVADDLASAWSDSALALASADRHLAPLGGRLQAGFVR